MLHNLFLDVSIFKAVSAIQKVIDSSKVSTPNCVRDSVLYEDRIGDLYITVKRDATDASHKEVKIIGMKSFNESAEEVAQRNLLKGITADESVVAHVSGLTTNLKLVYIYFSYFGIQNFHHISSPSDSLIMCSIFFHRIHYH